LIHYGSLRRNGGHCSGLASYLLTQANNAHLSFVGRRLFSNLSLTFRQGALRQWKQHFDPETRENFKRIAGRFLIQYGYENNDEL